jgi:hypothetical protein
MPDGGRKLDLPPVHLRGPIPFVGRAGQLAALSTLLAAPPCLVVVEGEAGIGKTRLVLRAVEPGSLAGEVTLLLGTCDDVPEPFLLGALLEAIRGTTAQLPAAEELDPVIGALAPLLPELAAVLPPVPPATADPAAERHRQFRALAAVLAALAPAVLVLEDLHWADPATADFIAYLAGHPIPGVAVVVTTRVLSAAEAPIHDALSRAPAGSLVRISLPPLDAADIRELAGRTLNLADPPARLTATLLERTAGLPFVVEEVLRSLAERGGDPLDDIAVPYLLRDVVLLRLRALDRRTAEVLGAAAVLGMVPQARILTAALGLDLRSVNRALAEATRAGLLHDVGTGPRFRHELARRAVYELLPDLTRNLLHRNIARVLEGNQPRPVAILAQHYRLAGASADFVRTAEAAADLATRQGDDATAARYLLQTMDIAELPRPTRVRLAGKLGRSAIDGLSQASAIPVLERLLADPRLPPGARGDLGLVLGRLLRQQAEALRGYTEIERALPYIRSEARRAQALAVLAAPDTVVGRHVREHLARCAEAEQAAERSNDPGARLAVRIARSSLLIELGDPAAWPAITGLRAEPALTGRPREHARACLNWAQGMLHSGHLDHALTLAAAGRQLVEESGYERLLALCELTDLSLDRALGRGDRLESRLNALLAMSARFPVIRLETTVELALVRAAGGSGDASDAGAGDGGGAGDAEGAGAGDGGGAGAGDGGGAGDAGTSEAAEQALRAVIAEAERVGSVWPLIRARSSLSRLLRDRDPGAAQAQAASALLLVREKGIWAWAGEAVQTLAETAVTTAERAQAEAAIAEFAAGLSGRDAPIAARALRRSREVLAQPVP